MSQRTYLTKKKQATLDQFVAAVTDDDAFGCCDVSCCCTVVAGEFRQDLLHLKIGIKLTSKCLLKTGNSQKTYGKGKTNVFLFDRLRCCLPESGLNEK